LTSDITPAEIHNRDVGSIVRSIIKPTLDAGGEITDILVMLESVIVGVMLFAVKPGGDQPVLDNVVEGVLGRLAEQRRSKNN
jgi:hypothetical protein